MRGRDARRPRSLAKMADHSITRYLADRGRRHRPVRAARTARRLPGPRGDPQGPAPAPASSSTSWPVPWRATPTSPGRRSWSRPTSTPWPWSASRPFPGDLAIEKKSCFADAVECVGGWWRAPCGLWRPGRTHRQLRQGGRPVRGRLPIILLGRLGMKPQQGGGPGVLVAAQRARRPCARFSARGG